MENVVFVFTRKRNCNIGLNLSEQVQQLLRQKADEYGVTPQVIADQACAELYSISAYDCEKAIEEYAQSL